MGIKFTTVQHYWIDGDAADIDEWETKRKPGETWYRADRHEMAVKLNGEKTVFVKKQ